MSGIENLRGKVDFQINFTITKRNAKDLLPIFDLADSLGAKALHFFFLVPTGRGSEEDLISPEMQEELLSLIDIERSRRSIEVQVTCAPQYARIARSGSGRRVRGLSWPERASRSSPDVERSIRAATCRCLPGTSESRVLRRSGRTQLFLKL